jgi:hypothetical protein
VCRGTCWRSSQELPKLWQAITEALCQQGWAHCLLQWAGSTSRMLLGTSMSGAPRQSAKAKMARATAKGKEKARPGIGHRFSSAMARSPSQPLTPGCIVAGMDAPTCKCSVNSVRRIAPSAATDGPSRSWRQQPVKAQRSQDSKLKENKRVALLLPGDSLHACSWGLGKRPGSLDRLTCLARTAVRPGS